MTPTITRSPPTPPSTFGEVIRDARHDLEWSLRDLATRMQVTPSYISDIEHDRRIPSAAVTQLLASALSLDVDDLLARAGRISDETELYMRRHPSAGTLLRLIASKRLSDDELRMLLDQVERMRGS